MTRTAHTGKYGSHRNWAMADTAAMPIPTTRPQTAPDRGQDRDADGGEGKAQDQVDPSPGTDVQSVDVVLREDQ
jgi:hypothetical protein